MKCRKTSATNHFFNGDSLLISAQQLQLSIRTSIQSYFRRVIKTIGSWKSDFQNSYFLERATLSDHYSLRFLLGYRSFLGTSAFKTFKVTLGIKILYKQCIFFKTSVVVVHSLRWTTFNFTIFLKRTGVFYSIRWGHPFYSVFQSTNLSTVIQNR